MWLLSCFSSHLITMKMSRSGRDACLVAAVGAGGGALIPNKRLFFFPEKRCVVRGSSLFDMIARGEEGWGS